MPPIRADACDARHIEIEAAACIGVVAIAALIGIGGVGAIAHAPQAANGPAIVDFSIEQIPRNPRDPLLAWAREPEFGSPAGDIYVTEDFL
jgi:hypothetical protein